MCVAVFRKNVKASAVCRFSLTEVQEAFQGPYMENQDSGSKWKEYTGKIPDPRPGTVNSNTRSHTQLLPLFKHRKKTCHSLLWPSGIHTRKLIQSIDALKEEVEEKMVGRR